MPLTGRQKATILLSLLGAEISSQILKFLPEELQDLITSGMNNLPAPSPELISSVINEFSGFMALPSGKEEVNNIPKKVVDTDVPKVTKTQHETLKNPYDILFYTQPRKVAAALSAERIPIIAFVLSILPDVQRKEVLSYFGDKKTEIEKNIKMLKNSSLKDQIKDTIVKILTVRLERLSLS